MINPETLSPGDLLWYTTLSGASMPAVYEGQDHTDELGLTLNVTTEQDLFGNGYGWDKGVRTWGYLRQFTHRPDRLPFDDEYDAKVTALVLTDPVNLTEH